MTSQVEQRTQIARGRFAQSSTQRVIATAALQPAHALVHIDACTVGLAAQRVALFQQCGNLCGALQRRAIVAASCGKHEHVCQPWVCPDVDQRAAVKRGPAIGIDSMQALQELACLRPCRLVRQIQPGKRAGVGTAPCREFQHQWRQSLTGDVM